MEFDTIAMSLFIASAVRLSAPIMLTALGEIVSQRAGVFNIGLEGIMLLSAFGAVLGLQLTHSAVLGIAVGGVCGILSAALLALLVTGLRASQIVVGIGFNIMALGVTSLLRQALMNKPSLLPPLRSVTMYKVPLLWELPVAGRGFFMQSPLWWIGIFIAAALWLILKYSRAGLVLRAVGEGSAAADAAGISVTGVRTAAMLFTGLMAGLGGSYLAIVSSGGTFTDDLTGGRGYLAVAVVIFSRWKPGWVVLAALLFGCADALQYNGQNMGIPISPPLLLMFPFVLTLIAWVVMGKSKSAPADLGEPFIRGKY